MQTWLVHLAGKPESWYATRASKAAAARLANELNRQFGRIQYEVSPAHWSNPDIHIDIDSHNTRGRGNRASNPLTRIKKSKIRTQPSQSTGLDPDERLIKRRKKTAAQPMRGVYANPLTRVTVTSESQRFHEGANGPTKSPTGRLRARRKTTNKAPPGFYANPETLRDRVMPHMNYVVHGNDIWLACFPMKAMADEYRALMAKAHPSRDFKVKPLD